jgi:hypothetical protein
VFKSVADTAPAAFGVAPLATRAAPPPELPGQRPRGGAPLAAGGASMLPMLAGAAVVVAALGGAYWWAQNSSGSSALEQQMAAITQPTPAPENPANAGSGVPGTALLPPPAGVGGTDAPLLATPPSTAQIGFVDVPPTEATQPIVADGSEKMPEDVGLIASVQQAIAAEKAKQAGAVPGQPLPETPAEKREDSANQLQASLQEELAAYRKALAQADSVAAAPKPSEFFDNPKAYMGTAPGESPAVETASTAGETVSTDGALLPPPAANSGSGVPPAELFTNNPNNLPIVAEPTAAQVQKIRTLEDFDVAAFEPENDRVRIPQGLKPRLTLGEFPALEVLSFVPGKGLIGLYDGNEGVLLLGESLEGWQLVNVTPDNAEFKKGNKTNYVSAE